MIHKGYIIDCDYVFKVVNYMYPRPVSKNVIKNYDELLPIISVECGLW